MPYVRAEVELEDIFEDVDDDEMIDEMERRGYGVISDKSEDGFNNVNVAIHFLCVSGCPEDLIDQLAEWARQPVATREALEEWLRLCGRVAH